MNVSYEFTSNLILIHLPFFASFSPSFSPVETSETVAEHNYILFKNDINLILIL